MKRLGGLVQKYGFAIHPVLFSVFPLLSFYGSNASEIRSGDFNLVTFVIFNLLVGAAVWLASLAITRDRRKASLLALVFLVIFFAFGRVEGQIEDFKLGPIGPTKILLLVGGLMIFDAWLWLRQQPSKKIKQLNGVLGWVSLVMAASTLVSIIPPYLAKDSSDIGPANKISTDYSAVKDKPDIYYIVLDGYTRADFLKDDFGLDNSVFINSLKQKGFYVADKSHSNYAHTHLSLPSTLSMRYLDDIAKQMGPTSNDRTPLKALLDENAVARTFKSFGYKYVQIGSQWGWTEKSQLADVDIEAKNQGDGKILGIPLDEFAQVYLQTTAVKPWLSSEIRGGLLAKTLGAFEKTEAVASIKEPTFTFAHIVTPHPPYLFDRNGIIKGRSDVELLGDGFSDRDKFADQTVYVNKLILEMVDTILKRSDKPPIIVIASDHGAQFKLSDFKAAKASELNAYGVQERMANLNTYYFPDQNYAALYPEITPVNSFRQILKQYFGQKIEPLPDRSYFSNNRDNQYHFLDVTELVKTTAPKP